MALETLKGVGKIGGFDVQVFEGSENYLDSGRPIGVCHASSELTFRIQNGPIKENGVNGCDISTIIEAAKLMLVGINKKESHSPHKSNAIAHLFSAMSCLEHDT